MADCRTTSSTFGNAFDFLAAACNIVLPAAAEEEEDERAQGYLGRSTTERLVQKGYENGSWLRKVSCVCLFASVLGCCSYFFASFKVDEYHTWLAGEQRPVSCDQPWYTWYLTMGIFMTIQTINLGIMVYCYSDIIMDENLIRHRHYKEEGRIAARSYLRIAASGNETLYNAFSARSHASASIAKVRAEQILMHECMFNTRDENQMSFARKDMF